MENETILNQSSGFPTLVLKDLVLLVLLTADYLDQVSSVNQKPETNVCLHSLSASGWLQIMNSG